MEKIKFKRKEKRKKKLHLQLPHCLFMLLLGFQCLQLSAQTPMLNLSMKKVSLHDILMEIKKQSGKNMVYNNNLIEKYNDETIELKNAKIEDALKKVLEGKDLRYKIVDDVIIIEPVIEKQQPIKPVTLYQTLKGTVVDAKTNIPLIGATVAILGSEKTIGTTTDLDGNFKITEVPVGRQTVLVSYVGYKKKQFDNIMVLSAKENILDARLEESVEKLDEVKIIAYNKNEPINDMAPVSARAFTIEETEKFAGSWGDPARMATNYAGVFTAGDQRNDIIIRGNSPTGLLWQLEDIPIPSPNHFDVQGTSGGPMSMLNNNLLSRSDFFTSAFPSEYGNATSGVFDLKMRNGNYEKQEFLLQCGFNGFEGGVEGPISRKHKSSYIINMRYSMFGLIQKLLWVDGLPQYEDVSFKLNFPLKSGKISVFGLGGASYISMEEDDDIRSNETSEFKLKSMNGSKTGILGMNYLHIFNSKTLLKAAIAVSTRRPHEDEDSTLNGNTYLHLNDNLYKQNGLTLTSKLTRKLNAKNTASLGIVIQDMSFDAERMTYDDDNNMLIIDEPYAYSNQNIVLSQAYVQWKHNFTDLLDLNAGVNVQHFHYNNTSAIDPRIGLSWQIAKKQSIGFGYGLHSQIQPLNVYFIQSKTSIDANGRQVYTDLGTNKNLDFTKSHHFAVSYNYSFTPNLRLKTEAYYQHLYNVPVKSSKGYFSLINSGAAMSVPEEDSLINKGYGKNYGLEFTLEKFLSNHYYFLITSSLFNSLYQGSDKVWRNTAYNGHYVINVLGGYEYELKENVMLNMNLRTVYAGGRRIIPVQPNEVNGTHYRYDQAYEKQVKDYYRIDIRIGILFQRKKTTHEFALDIANVTNHKNVYREKYDSETNKVKTYYQQGIFPMGLYRINF
jgi:hypothetical protein